MSQFVYGEGSFYFAHFYISGVGWGASRPLASLLFAPSLAQVVPFGAYTNFQPRFFEHATFG
ncbi:hypothetical protein LJB77_00345 [Ruminococcaceae bacterium OttesenSCG-928-N02]|nr:hypothetical protein [Ruminococcaceae bacterium OttesenSCG-928-N02]